MALTPQEARANPRAGAQEGDHQGFGEALADEATFGGTRGRPDGRLPHSTRGPGQEEVGQVHAGDHEKEADRSQKNPKGPSGFRLRHPLAGGSNGDTDTRQFSGETLFQPLGHSLQIRLAPLQRHPRVQPTDDGQLEAGSDRLAHPGPWARRRRHSPARACLGEGPPPP